MIEQDLVSIIVPSYKRSYALVERAINSLLQQTYNNIEIILVDDNAKPEHIEFRLQLQKLVNVLSSPKLVYIKNEKNLGGSLSRNQGINLAKGDFITFLDDDDCYEKCKIEKQLLFMKSNLLDVCFSDLSIYNEKDRLIDYRCHKDIKSFDNEYLFKYHLTKQITGTPTFMYKKDVLRKIGGFDDAIMGQEFYLMAKTIQNGFKIGYFPESNIRAYRYDIEAISTGKNKIAGAKIIYDYKRKYFNILSFSEKQYIKCRHYAVLAVAYKRNKNILKCLLFLVLSVLSNPKIAIKEAIGLIKRKKGL